MDGKFAAKNVFLKVKILTAGFVCRANMHQRTKFCVDCLNHCGDMAVKMAAVCSLGF